MKIWGMRRPVYYFIRQAEIYVFWSAVGSLAMTAYIWLINAEGAGIQEVFAYAPSVVMYMSMIELFVLGMSSSQYSVLVSFGCRRVDAFTGILSGNLLFIAQMMILYGFMLTRAQGEIFNPSIQTVLAGCLILEGVSKLLGLVSMRWGKAAHILMTVIVVIFAMFFGAWAGYAGIQGVKIPFAAVMSREVKWQILILSAGTVICALSNLAAYRIFRKFEVKA